MTLPRLPRRLRPLLALLPRAAAVADVGAGHGALAVHLAARDVPCVIATEAAAGPLAELRRNLARWGADGVVDVRLGDGLAPLAPGEVEGIVVAGMGARSLIAICSGASEHRVRWAALQCVQDAELVEPWVRAQGWSVLASCLATERGRTYPSWVLRVAA